MNNEDFRKLLQQTRAAPVPATGKSQDNGARDRNDKVARDSLVSTGPRTNKALAEINAKYVDRAELRRKGVEDLGVDPIEMKGLDFSLLAKARAERVREQQKTADQRAAKREGSAINGKDDVVGLNDAGEGSRASLTSGKSKQGRQLARAIEAALLEVTKDEPSNLKASLASTSYIYATYDDKYEVPVVRKRALTTKGATALSELEVERSAAARSPLPRAVIDEICTIMRYCGDVDGTRRVSRETGVGARSSQPGTLVSSGGPVHPVQTKSNDKTDDESDEDDIFGDAGTDYVPTATKEPDGGSAKPATYFSGFATVAPVADDTGKDIVEGGNAGTRVVEEEKHARFGQAARRVVQSDGYDECYPDYYGEEDVASDVEEPVEEQGPPLMTKKARKLANKKEQARLDSEMNSIQKIFEDKGYNHFAEKAPKEKLLADRVPQKKRRI